MSQELESILVQKRKRHEPLMHSSLQTSEMSSSRGNHTRVPRGGGKRGRDEFFIRTDGSNELIKSLFS